LAKIENKRLYLSEKERPEWWKPEEVVQIIKNNDEMFFLWHKQQLKEGYIKIDEYYSIEVEMIQKKWFVKEHSPECICVLNQSAEKIREKVERGKKRLEDDDFLLSVDLRDIDNMTKEGYIRAFKELLAKLLNNEIGVEKYKAAKDALELLIREYELFEPEERAITTVEELKQKLLQKAQEPNANIMDLIRSIKSLDEDGNLKARERVLDDIIIETEETGNDLEELEIEI
jgi:hypothetical protein